MTNPLLSKKTRGQKHDIIEEVHNHHILYESRELFLHGEPDGDNSDSGVDYRMATKFLKNIRILEQSGDAPIIIHQYNIGGLVDAGLMIYDSINTCSCHIIFITYGSACSIGSLIPQAADTRVVAPNCSWMIHAGYTGIGEQTYRQSQIWAEMEKKQFEEMLDIYTRAICNGPFFQENDMDESKVRKFLVNRLEKRDDLWLLPEETVLYGFNDGILSSPGWETVDIIKNRIENT